MKKIILVMLSLLVVFMFLVGCAEQAEETVEVVDEEGNLVGEASRFAFNKYKLRTKESSDTCNSFATISRPLYEQNAYVAEVKLGGESYPFSFNQEEGILTFKYWGDKEIYQRHMLLQGEKYIGNFKTSGMTYAIEIILEDQPKLTLKNWPGLSGDYERALIFNDDFVGELKMCGKSHQFTFDQQENKVKFTYWENGVTFEKAVTKQGNNYVGDFKFGGKTYTFTIDMDMQPPKLTLENWPTCC